MHISSSHLGIRTQYRGINFRSRIEARRAAFFDGVGWPWEYEPVDLGGYIPDFVLGLYRPVLVEVKSELTPEALEVHAERLARRRWDGEMLLLGAALFAPGGAGSTTVGLLLERGPGGGWGEARAFHCRRCGRVSIHHDTLSFRCRVHGCHDGDHHLGELPESTIRATWAAASNAVQWRGRTR